MYMFSVFLKRDCFSGSNNLLNFILFPDCFVLFRRQRIKNFVYCFKVGCLILLGEVILLLKKV